MDSRPPPRFSSPDPMDGGAPGFIDWLSGGLGHALNPNLHDRQIEEAEKRRIARQLAEKERMEEQMLGLAPAAGRKHDRRRAVDRIRKWRKRNSEVSDTGDHNRGVKRMVWCVELGVRYHSITQAARFIGRTASNIGQSIRSKGVVRCGGYTWENYDPAKHKQTSERPRACVTLAAGPAADTTG